MRAGPAADRGGPVDAGARDLELRVRAGFETVRTALIRIGAELPRRGLSPTLCEAAELVLAEVLNNIVEHAYSGRDEGWIEILLHISDRELSAQLTDAGAPMPGLSPPPGQAQSLDVPLDDMPEGGFGWHLIHSLTTDLTYERHDGRNRLRFRLVEPAP